MRMRMIGAASMMLFLVGADEGPQVDWHLVTWNAKEVTLLDIGTMTEDGGIKTAYHGIIRRDPAAKGGYVEQMLTVVHDCMGRKSAVIQQIDYDEAGADPVTIDIPEKLVSVARDPVAAKRLDAACGDFSETVHAPYHAPDGDTFAWAREAIANPAKMKRDVAEARAQQELQAATAQSAGDAAQAAADAMDAASDDMNVGMEDDGYAVDTSGLSAADAMGEPQNEM